MTAAELRAGLRKLGLDSLDVRLLVKAGTGLDEIHQLTDPDTEVDGRETLALAGRRLSGEPMAYILGEKEFYGLPFRVSPEVLIPRPDTETLVDTALELSHGRQRILDLCTGSGAVAAALAYTLRRPVAASDISPGAVETARLNYRAITGQEPDIRLGSLFGPWEGESFDLVVSNPPYLTDEWYEETDRDVKAEPGIALLGGGEDGLGIIRELVRQAAGHIREDGALALECDYRQIALCGMILESNGFKDIQVRKDLAGKERVIYGRRLS